MRHWHFLKSTSGSPVKGPDRLLSPHLPPAASSSCSSPPPNLTQPTSTNTLFPSPPPPVHQQRPLAGRGRVILAPVWAIFSTLRRPLWVRKHASPPTNSVTFCTPPAHQLLTSCSPPAHLLLLLTSCSYLTWRGEGSMFVK